MNRLLKYINSAIAIACIAALGALYWYGWRVLPQTDGFVTAPIGAQAKAVRDSSGIPHITAATDVDAWFVQGYVTAQDRLFQLEFTRRQAAGELAAVFGAAGVENDVDARTLRLRRLAERYTRELAPGDLVAFTAYARGVNHFIETHRDRLPAEFTLARFDPAPWTVTDCILVGLQMFRMLTIGWRDEVAKATFAAGGDSAKTEFLFPVRSGAEPSPGSNAWVIAGNRTRSGKPILSNDPHLSFTYPGLWYQIEIQTPEFDVAGVSLPGVPSVIIGHNSHIAWGMTNLQYDVQDLYRERINLQAGMSLYQRQPDRLVQEMEIIRVRGAASREMRVVSTRHGPIYLTQPAEFALRWTASESGVFSFPFPELARAANWQDFRSALSRFGGPPENFVYADVNGNIGYQVGGKLPIRRSWNGDIPADGTSGDREWEGFIPFEELPTSYNPASGIIVTANQNPFPVNYPYRVNGNFAAPYRARQVQALLSAKSGGWQPRDMTAIQTDVYSPFSHFLAQEVVGAWQRRGKANPALSAAGQILSNWNGQMSAGTAAPFLATLVFEQIRKQMADRVLPGRGNLYELPLSTSVVERLLREKPADWFPDFDGMLIRALTDAVQEGSKIQGSDVSKWDYGRWNQLTLSPPVVDHVPLLGSWLKIGPVPMSGSTTTVKQTTPRLGPSMRMTVDLGDLNHVLLNVTTGVSGQALSRHYRDQWEAYYSGTPLSMQYGKVEAGDTLTFVPHPQP